MRRRSWRYDTNPTCVTLPIAFNVFYYKIRLAITCGVLADLVTYAEMFIKVLLHEEDECLKTKTETKGLEPQKGTCIPLVGFFDVI